MGETIKESNVLTEYVNDGQIYAIALCRKQAVPDVRDGLKTGARRILEDMGLDEKLYHNGRYSKAAGTVGSTMKNYHPHGDSSIYGVMVNMAQWWSYKMPFIDGHGGWGTIQGDPESAYRYTECRLSEYADTCMLGLLYQSRNIVDWVPNYNDETKEAEYLPCTIPNLLINGTLGIAIGMKVEIPTHNLVEVCDAAIAVLKDPSAQVVLIPDHCQKVDIIDTDWKTICNTGYGTYRARGIVDIEYDKDIPCLVIKSVPNGVTLINPARDDEGVIGNIKKMVKEGKMPFVTNVIDETDEKRNKYEQLRYVIRLKKGTDPNYVRSLLYKKTLLENTYRVNFEGLEGIELHRYSYKSYIETWINFAMILKFRSYAAMYQKCKTRWTELQLYIKLMKSGEIDLIKQKISNWKKVDSAGKAELMEWIIKKFDVTDSEALFILNMDFFKTAIGYLPQYEAEVKELEAKCMTATINMNSDDILKQEIINDLEYYKKKFGTKRTCRVIKDKEDEIPAGTFKVVVTESNFIKRVQENDKLSTAKGNAPKFVLTVDNRENILLFDRVGKVFKVPVHKIALCGNGNPGTDLRLMIKGCTSDIIMMMYEPKVLEMSKLKHKHYLTVVTDKNNIKKMELEDFLNVPVSGILYTKLSSGDFVKDLTIIPEGLDVIVYTNHKALRFNNKDINLYKRGAMGDLAMSTTDEIDGLSVLAPNSTDIVVVTNSGRVNKINVSALPTKSRNKAGSNVIKLGKTDSILTILGAFEKSTLCLVTAGKGIIEIPVSDIKQGSSVSAGEKLVSDMIIKAYIR